MRILLIQTAPLGDVVLTTPLLRCLKQLLPESELTVISTATGCSLLRGSPWIDRLWSHDKHPLRFAGQFEILGRIRAARFDVAIAAHRSFRTAVGILWSGASVRIGFRDAAGSWAYNRKPERDLASHAVTRYLALARPLGASGAGDPSPELLVHPLARERIDTLLADEGIVREARLACVAPGAARPTKRWLPRGFAVVVDAVASRGLQAVLVGTAEERELCQGIADRCRRSPVVLAGRTGIPELMALLSRAEVLVGNDSGTAHVAAAFGTPVISVYGPTVPEMGYHAYGTGHRFVGHDVLDCRPCDHHGPRQCPLGHFRCMRELGAERVVAALDAVLDHGDRAAQRLPG